MKNKFSIQARLKSFSFALSGLKEVIKTQHNFWIHCLATLLVIILGFIYHLSSTEWCLIILAIGLVLIVEIINTAIEYLVDLVSPEINAKAGKVKDIAAGAVFVAALISLVIGVVVFLPKIY